MRHDALGLFWNDLPKPKGSRKIGDRPRGPAPNIPDTGWRTPDFPNLAAAKVIGVDTETFDPELRTAGPGWGRGRGHIIGISLAVEDGSSWYFPMRHETCPEQNLDPAAVLGFMRHTLGDARPKVGANLIYDVGWLAWEGVPVGGRLYDVQFAEALLNSETPRTDLDSLAEKYLGRGKVTSILYDWLADWLGGPATERQRENLYLSPPTLAGPYAEADAALPIAILNQQWPALAKRGVLDLFDLECRLIPLLVAMRLKGAPVDVAKAEQSYDELTRDLEGIEARLRYIAGQPVNPNARESLVSAFEALGLPTPTKRDTKTKKTKVSFDAPTLEALPAHPLVDAILEHRRTTKVRDTFIRSYILNKNVNGRLYCTFHPLKGESGGTRSGRFSSSDPNLQNIPVRTELGRRVRSSFVAQGVWKKGDYSQIEYRMLAHHAVGPGAQALRNRYNNDPSTDYHDVTTVMVYDFTGRKLARRPIKNINFGLIYGMSEPKLAAQLGLTDAEGRQLFADYHAAAPYARATMQEATAEVQRLGYVETILGRKSDFPKWTRKGYDPEAVEMEFDEAAETWGMFNIERSRTHKALNRKLQGGAADVMKAAMVAAYEAGLFAEDACGMPLLTVHDELDFDDLGDPDAPCWQELTHVMETAVPQMLVPVKFDMGRGPHWGAVE